MVKLIMGLKGSGKTKKLVDLVREGAGKLTQGGNTRQVGDLIALPGCSPLILPPLGNEFIAMLKDSSLVSVIGFEELTRRGQLIIAQTYGSFEIWTTVAILYLIMTLAISRVVAALEKR